MRYDRETHARWGRQLSLPAAMMFRKRRGHTVYVCKLSALGTVREPVRRLRHDRSRSTRIQKSHVKLQPHSPSWQCCPFPPPPVLQSVEEGVDISLLCSYAKVVLFVRFGCPRQVLPKFGNYYSVNTKPKRLINCYYRLITSCFTATVPLCPVRGRRWLRGGGSW